MFFKNKLESEDQPISLPVTPEELDVFMANIIKTYDLPDTNDTRDSICTLILHMPQSVSKAPLSFFASSVNKARANKAAYEKLKEYAELRKTIMQNIEGPSALTAPPTAAAQNAVATQNALSVSGINTGTTQEAQQTPPEASQTPPVKEQPTS